MTRCECGLSLVRGKLSLMVTRLWCLTGTEVQGYHPHDPALYYLFKIIIKRHKIPPIHNERSIYYSTFLILKNRKPKLSLTIECCLIDCIHGLFKVPSRILHRYGDVTDADLCVALKITPFEGRKFYIRIVAVTRDFGPSSALRQARIAKDLSLLGVSLGPLKLVICSWCSSINLLHEKTFRKDMMYQFRHFQGQCIYKQISPALLHWRSLKYTVRNTDTNVFPRQSWLE